MSAAGLPRLRIEAVELYRVTLPLIAPFRTSWGELTDREVVLVRVVSDDGAEGWGECAALPVAGYTAETTASAWVDLRERLIPHLLAGAESPVAGPMATGALEAAQLDAACRTAGVALADHLASVGVTGAVTLDKSSARTDRPGALTTTRRRVASGAVVSITGHVDAVVGAAEAAVAAGHRRVKLKIEPGWDAEPLRAVRRTLGPDAALGADANGSYEAANATERLEALDDLGLVMVEQPLAAAAGFEACAALAAAIATPVCLDEAVLDPGDATAAGRAGAVRIVNVKPGRVGGLLRAVAVTEATAAAGLSAFVGGMLETGIGRAAALALAARPEFDLPSDLGPSARYFAEDLTEPFALDAEGYLPVPSGGGLGVTPRRDVLRRATVERILVRL